MKYSYPILVAEDNQVSRKLLEKSLVRAGHEVITAENGHKALDVFKERFFPIVLTDWMMPEMDGIELCRAIRNMTKESGYVFIIILTAKDSKGDIVTGLEAGADDYLTKPVNQTELIARIKTGIRILDLERSLKKAHDEVRVLSITDALTGCYNRTYMNEHLPKEIKRAKRYRHALSMVLCDIDHFKRVNDDCGHQAGDCVLKEFVVCIKETIRENVDWMARYGGEEFLVVFPETDLSGACVVAERLRQAISQKAIQLQEKKIHITASFGVTGFSPGTSDDTITPDTMVNQADKYLYQAKKEGRNRVKAGQIEDH